MKIRPMGAEFLHADPQTDGRTHRQTWWSKTAKCITFCHNL